MRNEGETPGPCAGWRENEGAKEGVREQSKGRNGGKDDWWREQEGGDGRETKNKAFARGKDKK